MKDCKNCLRLEKELGYALMERDKARQEANALRDCPAVDSPETVDEKKSKWVYILTGKRID